ncbi:hypothetical protein CRE_03052 [Caenorhabditis remanei]|uniref:Sdz-33 F-box domain-containing protein n=1 Tax=Caenorhabditis remanei TaxID=31234 RepID=E3LWB0_CAERE|nr:hypothetical protein CRE_03052 [Caenorhabditis remanei]
MQYVQQPKFPLTKLPDVVLRLFVALLGVTERICYSLCSKRCAFRTKRPKFKVDIFGVKVGSTVEIILQKFNEDIIELTFLTKDDLTRRYPIPIPPPIAITIKYFNGTQKTHSPQKLRSLKQFLCHFGDIFSFEKGAIIPERGCERFTFDSLKAELEGCGLKELNMRGYNNKIYGRQLLKTFLPWSILTISHWTYDKNWQFQKYVLKHKMDALLVCSYHLNFYELMYDMDIKHIEFSEPIYLNSELNEFIKTWIDGETNVNLESLCLRFRSPLFGNYQQSILDGIKHQLVHTENPFMPPFRTINWTFTTSIIGKYEITRKTDGKRATIKLDELNGDVRLKFIVWK